MIVDLLSPSESRLLPLSLAGPNRWPQPPTLLICLVLLVFWPAPSFALNPSRDLSQYAHSAWRPQDGVFSGIPTAITQTTDGYIWIGTNLGLVRFDGTRFVRWAFPPSTRLLDSRVFSLLGASDGSLWIGTGYSIARWDHGQLVNYPEISGRIESISEDTEGSVWLARTQVTDGKGPVCRFKSGLWQCYGKADAFPLAYTLHLAKGEQGNLWVAGYSDLCLWKPGSLSFYSGRLTGHPRQVSTLRAIAAAHDGSVWAAVDRGMPGLHLDHFEGAHQTTVDVPGTAVTNGEVTSLFVDGNGALWIGTAHRGVLRFQGGKVEHIGAADGLSGDAVEDLFEDAEGNVWVATSEGIDSLRDLQVATYSMREGLSADGAVSVLGGRDGSLWIGNLDALDLLRDGKFSVVRSGSQLRGRFVNTLFEDHLGRLWVGADNVLWVDDRGSFRSVGSADGSPLGTIFAITEDTNHIIWVREGPRLDHVQDGKLVEPRTSPEISTAYTLAANPQGGLIMGLVNGDLVYDRDGATQAIASHETGNTRQIRDLSVDADGSAWGTTVDELAHWKDGRRRNLTVRNGLPCDGIFALVQDASRAIWLYTRCGLVRITRPELDRWWQAPDSVVKVTVIDQLAGVQPGLTGLKPQATRTPDGRLWFVNGRILQMFDPADSSGNKRPPPVHVEEVIADRHTYAATPGLRLPPLTGDLEIDYTALSFVAPRKVFFRYMLEGHDRTWQDPGARRQAFYSDLPPSSYRFKVIACNNDGVWNDTGAELTFTVLPTFYQTWWFRLLYITAGLAAVWLLYLFRLRQATEKIQARLGARMEERERIARELHDTLLQGFQGLVLRFQAIINVLPKEGPARAMIEKALDRADEVLLEGRERVQELRVQGVAESDLADGLARYGSELAQDHAASFSLAVVGTPQPIDTIVNHEVYRIGREAMSNAFLHSQGTKVEVELTYEASGLWLRVRDDGQGIPENILAGGRSGHWGLSGMRERAEKIGGSLHLWSRPSSGTEVDLTIPARFAYPRGDRKTWWEHLRRVIRPGSE